MEPDTVPGLSRNDQDRTKHEKKLRHQYGSLDNEALIELIVHERMIEWTTAVAATNALRQLKKSPFRLDNVPIMAKAPVDEILDDKNKRTYHENLLVAFMASRKSINKADEADGNHSNSNCCAFETA